MRNEGGITKHCLIWFLVRDDGIDPHVVKRKVTADRAVQTEEVEGIKDQGTPAHRIFQVTGLLRKMRCLIKQFFPLVTSFIELILISCHI